MSFEINNISFYYGETLVLDNISINFTPGKFYGILGPNGCGKTTLLDLLIKHNKPASGSIRFNNRDIRDYSKKELSKAVSYVSQNFYINFPFTVRETVMMGRHPHIGRFSQPSGKDHEIVDRVMDETGILHFSNRFITELSGGERQRAVFARALAQDSPWLILDEATSSLDINHSIHMMNIAADGVRKNGKSIIAVLQDVNLASIFCDYLVFVKSGKIVAHGLTDEILDEPVLKKVFDIESKVYFESYSDSKQVVFKR